MVYMGTVNRSKIAKYIDVLIYICVVYGNDKQVRKSVRPFTTQVTLKAVLHCSNYNIQI